MPNQDVDIVDLTSDAEPDVDSDSDVHLGRPPALHNGGGRYDGQDESADSDDDEDLKRAIVLSLADAQQPGKATADAEAGAVVGDVRRTTFGSNKEYDEGDERRVENKESGTDLKKGVTFETAPALTASNEGGILGLDRKAMEMERLARLKRKREHNDSEARPVSPPPMKKAAKPPVLGPGWQTMSTLPSKPASATTTAQSSSEQSMKSPLKTTSLPSHPHQPQRPSKPSAPSPTTSSIPYPKGIVKKTFSASHPESPTASMSFPSLISPTSTLQSALLSSFIWDFDWLFPHFSTKTTKFLLVMQGKDQLSRSNILNDFDGIQNVRVCFPPMEGNVNCMHSKLMLLFWEDRCRIVLPTGNLVGFDWGVGGYMENMLWCIDLPLKADAEDEEDETTTTEFQRSLIEFLKAQRVPVDAIRKLDGFDFANTKDAGFVHTIGGVHEGKSWRRTGLCGLGRTVSQMGLSSEQPEVDFVTSSVGSLNDEFMRSIYLACQGDDGLQEYTLRTAKSLPACVDGGRARKVSKDTGKAWKEKFRFYFPSEETVETSIGGKAGAGTVCFSRKWWEGVKFPRQNLKDCISVRQGLLMHNKIIFVKFTKEHPDNANKCAGWAYVGSANLSESAWGRLVQDRSSKTPRLTCRNWECGVVLPIHTDSISTSAPNGNRNLDIFDGHVPVPMLFPAPDMDGKQPWFFRD